MVEVPEFLKSEPGNAVETGKKRENETREMLPSVAEKQYQENGKAPGGAVELCGMDGNRTEHRVGK